MKAAGGRRALVTAALVIAGIRLWMQVRGKTKTPFAEWAIGWGALFFLLSIVAEVSPQTAGMFSLIVATSDVVVNGASLFNDISGSITEAEKGKTIFAQSPFGGPAGSHPTGAQVPPADRPGANPLTSNPPNQLVPITLQPF